MAELIGVVASGAGLASLAIQLGGSIIKLERFCSAVRTAHEDLRAVIFEVKTLGLVLRKIELDPVDASSNMDPEIMQHCVQICQDAVARIENVAATLEASIQSQRIPGMIKTVLKEKQIQEMFQRLDRAKGTLMIAYQAYTHERQFAAQRTQHVALEHGFASITSQLQSVAPSGASLIQQQQSEARLIQDDGIIDVNSGRRRRTRKSDSRLSRPSFIRLPFVTLVWHYHVTDAPRGWAIRLSCFAPIPVSSPIFQCCEAGDVPAVKALLDNGQASVRDQDPDGRTPLYYATRSRSIALCDLLLAIGSEPNDPDPLRDPLVTAAADHYLYQDTARYADMIRLFIQRHSMDVDFIIDEFFDAGRGPPFWYKTAPKDALTIIHQQFSLEYTKRPLQDRMRLAAKHTLGDPFAFCAILGTQCIEEILATEPDCFVPVLFQIVQSIGHIVVKAKKTRYRLYLSWLEGWRSLLQQLITAGTDPHTEVLRNGKAQTLMQVYLGEAFSKDVSPDSRCYSIEEANHMLQYWATLLEECGVDLNSFGKKEEQALQGRREQRWYIGGFLNPSEYVLDELYFGSQISDWKLALRRTIFVYRCLSLPGAWDTDWLPRRCLSDTIIPPQKPESGHWELERRIVLNEIATDLINQMPDFASEVAKAQQDDSTSVLVSWGQKVIRRPRRSESVATSMPSRWETNDDSVRKQLHRPVSHILRDSWEDRCRLSTKKLRYLLSTPL